jgi:ASC-1-like (ASCH) protein
MRIHELKTDSQYFEEQLQGNKNFEVRLNDRNFQNGDVLVLSEYKDNEYTGRQLYVQVTYILDSPNYCKDGYVIMSTKRLVIDDGLVK